MKNGVTDVHQNCVHQSKVLEEPNLLALLANHAEGDANEPVQDQGKFRTFKNLDVDKTLSDLSNDHLEDVQRTWQLLSLDTELNYGNLKRDKKC